MGAGVASGIAERRGALRRNDLLRGYTCSRKGNTRHQCYPATAYLDRRLLGEADRFLERDLDLRLRELQNTSTTWFRCCLMNLPMGLTA